MFNAWPQEAEFGGVLGVTGAIVGFLGLGYLVYYFIARRKTHDATSRGTRTHVARRNRYRAGWKPALYFLFPLSTSDFSLVRCPSMYLAWLSLAALLTAIVVSCFSRMNVGVLALAFAWIVGVYFGGMPLTTSSPVSGQLFLTLAGVTLLFAQAQLNGTLDKLAHQARAVVPRQHRLIPVSFFFLGVAIASLGPGNISTAAMLAPMAMAVAGRASIPPFLMAIMVGNGAQAGALSPFAPTGIIVNGLMDRIGLAGFEWRTVLDQPCAHAILAFGAYLLFGGRHLFRSGCIRCARVEARGGIDSRDATGSTLAVIVVVLAVVLFCQRQHRHGGVCGRGVSRPLRCGRPRAGHPQDAVVPIVMVCGVTVLIALLEKTGGLELFSGVPCAHFDARSRSLPRWRSSPRVISVYSSTSGVVLPPSCRRFPA